MVQHLLYRSRTTTVRPKQARREGAEISLTKTPVDVRPLAAEELKALERHIAFDEGNSDKHRKRLERQSAGKAVYLVAWSEDVALGHAILNWFGPPDYPIADKLDRCPDIQDLFVHPDHRSTGVGLQILRYAEGLAQHRGYPTIGLGVAIDRPRRTGALGRGDVQLPGQAPRRVVRRRRGW